MSRRPDIRSFVDSITNTTKSLDFQKIIRDRDCFLIAGNVELVFSPPDAAPAEYIETTWSMGAITTSEVVTFPTPFSANPIVSINLTPLSSGPEYDTNVAYWVTDITTTTFTANFSSRFRGAIVYRAVNITFPNIFSYPIYVQRLPASPGSYGWVSAASMSLNYQSAITMSWAALPTAPEFFTANPVGSSSSLGLDIAMTNGTAGVSSATSNLSNDFSGSIHFIALDTT